MFYAGRQLPVTIIRLTDNSAGTALQCSQRLRLWAELLSQRVN